MSEPPRWLIGQRVAWLGSGSGLPRAAIVRWIGRLPGMGAGWTLGIELDEALPLGGVDGKWAGRRLFYCKPLHGLFVPLVSVIPESDIRTRAKQGFGEKLWLKELEEEFKQIHNDALKKKQEKKEQKVLKNEARKENKENNVGLKKDPSTVLPVSKEEALIKSQKSNNTVLPPNDEEDQEANGTYQWYDAIDHASGETHGPVVEHLYEEVGGKVLGKVELAKYSHTVPHRRRRRRDRDRVETSDGSGGTAMTGVGAVGPVGQVESVSSGRGGGGLSSVGEGEGSYGTNSTQRRSGFFSFLRWFKRGKEEQAECSRDCEKEEAEREEAFDEVLDLPASPHLPSKFGTWSSVDTLASTSSFAFVPPADYLNPGVNHPELGIEAGPDTDTYRHRLRLRERSRHLDQDLTLRRKYRLHDFEVEPTPEQKRKILLLSSDVTENEEGEREAIEKSTVEKSVVKAGQKGSLRSQTSSLGRKKRRAPLPPGFDFSLPNTLEHPGKNTERSEDGAQDSRHQRSASESRTRGGYCHVRGKRKAPPPPQSHSPVTSTPVVQPQPTPQASKTSLLVKSTPPTSPRYGSFGRRKRAAPPPPVNACVREDKEVQVADGSKSAFGEGGHLSPEERRRLIANIAILRAHAERGKASMGGNNVAARGMGSPPGSPRPGDGQSNFNKNDYLRLEKGQLLPSVEKVNESVMGNTTSEQKATLSPRPWYKRKSVLRDSPTAAKRDAGQSPTPSFFKSLEKRKPWRKRDDEDFGALGEDEEEDDWMPEVGYRRPGGILGVTNSPEVPSKHVADDAKVDIGVEQGEQGKRRSQVISFLANISELDREAAAIVSEERKKEREAASAEDEKFYTEPELPPVLAAAWSGGVAQPEPSLSTSHSTEEHSLNQPKGNTKHLISLFNSISGGSVMVRNETRVSTSFISSTNAMVIEEEDSEEETERKRSTAETVQALVLDANRDRINGRRAARNGVNLKKSDKVERTAIEDAPSDLKISQVQSPAKEDPLKIWVCPRCTLENPKWRLTCDACNMWRPSGGGVDTKYLSGVESLVNTEVGENNSKMESKVGFSPGINWELELQKYFPKEEKKGENKTVSISEAKIAELDKNPSEMKEQERVTSSTDSALENNLNKKPLDSLSGDSASKKEFIVPNFIGGGVNNKVTNISKETFQMCKNENETGVATDLDEVRKARLAFFSLNREESSEKSSSKEDHEFSADCKTQGIAQNLEELSERKVVNDKALVDDSIVKAEDVTSGSGHRKKRVTVKPASVSVDTLSKSKVVDNEEKQKLRDMLKEMKNSLPHSHRSRGAIRKVIPEDMLIHEEIPSPPQNQPEKVAEAYLITTEKVYENIKVRCSPLPPGTKVSSSSQTSAAIVRRVTPAGGIPHKTVLASIGRPPYPSPPSAPSLSTINKGEVLIKDGILYTSLKRKVIGAGTFELIHAGDFASIEATKTEANGSPVHVYANLPPPGRVRASGAVRLLQQPSEGIPPAGPFPSHRQDSSHKSDGLQGGNAGEADTPRPPVSSSQLAKGYSKESEEMKDEEDQLAAQLTLPKGLARFKASLVPEDEGSFTDQEAKGRLNPDTLAVARLLRRLEAAIAGGQHESAAVLARQLARLKINCSVTRHANNRRNLTSNSQDSAADCGGSSAGSSTASFTKMTIDMYVEDKVSHLGPIPVVVSPSMTVGELKTRVEQDFEIPVNVQRWIIGRRLASNDELTLLQHDVTSNGTPVFLYLVAPGDAEVSASGNTSSKESRSSKASERGEESDHLEVNEIKEEVPSAPTAPEERIIARPLDDMPRGRGWYYNFEEDRYSYCSDSESDAEEVEQPVEPVQVQQNLVGREAQMETIGPSHPSYSPQDGVRLITADEESEEEEEYEEEEEEEEIEEEIEEEVEEEEEEEEVEEEENDEEVVGTAAVAAATTAVRGPATEASNQPELSASKTDTLHLGWKCPLCTLVNPPTRPGCAACASERPSSYRPPTQYKAGKSEAERLEKERIQTDPEEAQKRQDEERKHDYERLLHLERSELVPNAEDFACPVCFVDVIPNEGITLRDCLHSFCRPCLVNTIQFSEEAEVKCPYRDDEYACDSTLQDREIRALVPADVYEQLLARSMALAEKRMGAQAFHCKTPDCRGWCVLEENINIFPCPVCRRTNCLTCQSIHDGVNCKQYQEGLKKDSETNVDAKRTKDMLEEMVTRGEAIVCPTCAVVLMKKWGCDWLRCSMCKTEICWVTRGPRWGPGGKGDISGGCKCGVNGIKCHPKCNYCH